MAEPRWRGGAAAVAQIQTYTMAGTWEVGDIIRVTIGSKSWDYAVTSTVIATFLPLFVTAFNSLSADTYPEFAEITASATSPVLTLTMDEAGVPFTATLTPLESNGSAADAQTIEGVGVATAGTTATPASGAAHWDTATNWSTGAVPVNGDTVWIDHTADDIKYGFAQSGVTLLALNFTDSFTGTLGLPETNADGTAYPEYRATALSIGATTITVRCNSGRVKLNTGSVQTSLNVYATGSPTDSDETDRALLWKGVHASNALYATGAATVGVATLGSETATLLTLEIDAAADVVCGDGVTLGTVRNDNGTLVLNSAVSTGLAQTNGTTTLWGSGGVTALDIQGGTVNYNTSGVLGDDVSVSNTGTLTFDGDLRVKTVTAGIDLYGPSALIFDTNGVVTGGDNLTVNFFEGATAAQVAFGSREFSLTRATVP